MKSYYATGICGLGLLIPACCGLLLSGVPTAYCPLPTLTAWPALVLGEVAVIVPALLFFAWNPGLFRGEKTIPKRSYGLLAAVTALSVCWFVSSWGPGLEDEGAQFTRFVCRMNILWLGYLWILFIRQFRRAPSFKANLLLHWFLFAWLSWYAFPWLGELP